MRKWRIERLINLPEVTQKTKLDLAACCLAVSLLPRSLCEGAEERWLACPLLVPQVSPVRLLVLL